MDSRLLGREGFQKPEVCESQAGKILGASRGCVGASRGWPGCYELEAMCELVPTLTEDTSEEFNNHP